MNWKPGDIGILKFHRLDPAVAGLEVTVMSAPTTDPNGVVVVKTEPFRSPNPTYAFLYVDVRYLTKKPNGRTNWERCEWRPDLVSEGAES